MSLIESAYKGYVRPIVFSTSASNAEEAHERGLARLQLLEKRPWLANLVRRALVFSHPILATRQFGIDFPGPLGLAAGFDKYCQVYSRAVPACGWNFMEIGGFTPYPQDGNPGVRMLRSEKLGALWNFMGFNNPGADQARQMMKAKPSSSIPIGLNVGKGKDTSLVDAAEGYAYVIKRLSPFVQFIVINVSSPNTKDLRNLQAKEFLEGLLRISQIANEAQLPMGIKISPDESDEQLSDICDAAESEGLLFLILTNTTLGRVGIDGWNIPSDRGGISGRPLQDRSRWVLMQLAKRFNRHHKIRLISVGGIDSSEELYERILLGASLCQVYTAWPFEGPDLCKRWLKELVFYLRSDGFDSLDQAIGAKQ